MQPYWYCEWAREGWMADQKPEDHYIESGPYYLASEVDARIAELEKRIAHFEAGEYICQRCGIRQDPPKGEPAF